MVFENDVFLFAGHEEGRLRKAASGVVAYDYFIKDHLGNTRMVLTDETNTQYYPTLSAEGGSGSGEANNQNAIWDDAAGNSIDIVNRRVNRPGNFGTTGTNGNYAFSITKNGGSIGSGKLLKVMSGDNIYSSVDYFYHNNYADNSSANGLGSILNHIAGVIAGTRSPAGTAVKSANGAAAGNLGADGLFTGLFAPQSPSGGYTYQPKAYMHILLFNEQFKFDAANSYVVQVSAWVQESRQTLYGSASAKKNGYAYIYFSNESNDVVFFDNFNLTHQAGPLLEETHYYPFGLTMAGISSKAIGKLDNKFKYNGGSELQQQEFSDGSGLEMYDTHFRKLDPQLGRWLQVDPKPTDAESLYASMGNNPISKNDILGDTTGLQRIFGARTGNGDESGVLKTATSSDYENSPVGATLKDIGHAVFSLFGLNTVDNFIADRVDGKNSPSQILKGVIEVGFATTKGEGTAGNKILPTSRAARRQAMRDGDVPTSQPLFEDKSVNSKDKVYLTRDKSKTVQNATNDVSHQGQPHWEAGATKKDASKPDGLNRSGNNNKPQMAKPKAKVYYND